MAWLRNQKLDLLKWLEFYISLVSEFILANKNTKEIHDRTEVKNTIRFWLKNTTLVHNYCQWWQRYKSQIIKSKSCITGITQNKQMPYFHCGP